MTCPTAVKGRAPAAQNNTDCATRRPYYSIAGLSLHYYLIVPVIYLSSFCCLSLSVFIFC
ncbi:hypothetical protein DLO46_20765 [Salmonella enterica]|nr:hypothetical protein [Salmonella enterica]EBJ2530513.1 hypothetical protein [Salmonella enterica]EBK4146641.1 hypothetical protein [Salmonella enterica]ECO1612742.1 hypothetical protein [Salmonella enterica subsp. enterica serovar Paratyphi B]EDY4731502.1 hypothetical protein [Salmonella enterica subsp. salamae]